MELASRDYARIFAVLERTDRARSVGEFAGCTLEALGSVFGYRNTTFFLGDSYGGLFFDPDPALNGGQRRLFGDYRHYWDRYDVFSLPGPAAALRRHHAVTIARPEHAPTEAAGYLDWLGSHGLRSLSALHLRPGGRDALIGVFGGEGLVAAGDVAVLRVLGRQLAAISRHLPLGGPGRDVLTGAPPRQVEVARLVADGLTNAAIAARLALSEDTVKKYVSRLLTHTGTRSRTELALAVTASR